MRPVEPAAHGRAYPRENRDTIPTLSSALPTERNVRLAALFGSTARRSARSGGAYNLAGGTFASSVSGGKENKATGEESSISGGSGGEASAPLASIVGGRLGKAPYRASTVLGGLEEVTEAEFGVTP
jgi:hypothetical protein